MASGATARGFMALDMYRMHHMHRRVHITHLYEAETWWVEASLIMGDSDASSLVVVTVPGCRLADRCMGLAVRQDMTGLLWEARSSRKSK